MVTHLAVKIDRRLEAEVGTQQAQRGRRHDGLHCRCGNISLLRTITGYRFSRIQIYHLHAQRGITQRAVRHKAVDGLLWCHGGNGQQCCQRKRHR